MKSSHQRVFSLGTWNAVLLRQTFLESCRGLQWLLERVIRQDRNDYVQSVYVIIMLSLISPGKWRGLLGWDSLLSVMS